MNKKLQILNIDGVSYDISDKKAREDLDTIKAKSLTLSLETTKGGFMQ